MTAERKVRSPGKLILSGEHSVVQGGPALAMAVNLEVETSAVPLPENLLRLQLPGRPLYSVPLAQLPRVRQNMKTKPEPEELLAACAGMVNPGQGFHLQFSTDLPIGSGLGSSAAFLLSLLLALKPDLDRNRLRELAVRGEHLQHGKSSGLDVETSLNGGLLVFRNGKADFPELPEALPDFQLYHTGTPGSSTGDCVRQSRRVFRDRPGLAREFSSVTMSILSALIHEDPENWIRGLKKNHRLLCTLGVVPCAVQDVISRLEKTGQAGKVCGAGSITGDTAGMVLVSGSAPHPVPPEWVPLPVKLFSEGTRLIS